MAAVGGDILEITYNHPNLGGGTLFAKAGEDSTFDTGGYRSNDDANMITGSGQSIRQINRVRWSFECTIAADMNSAKELEKLADLSANPIEADWTISHINGVVYSGKGSPVGDVQANGNAATMTLKLSGGGTLKQI